MKSLDLVEDYLLTRAVLKNNFGVKRLKLGVTDDEKVIAN